MYFLVKKITTPLLWILDRIVIAVASGAIFIRLGNFFNSEIIGKETSAEYVS
jgi:prolipoprotein diacylglyceryltransferase